MPKIGYRLTAREEEDDRRRRGDQPCEMADLHKIEITWDEAKRHASDRVMWRRLMSIVSQPVWSESICSTPIRLLDVGNVRSAVVILFSSHLVGCSDIGISGLEATIMDLPHTIWSDIMCTNPIQLLDLEYLGLADKISFVCVLCVLEA